MRKLLVAVDGSDGAARAVDYLLDLAADLPMELSVVNVQPPFTGDVAMFVPGTDIERYHHEQGQEQVAPVLARLRAAGVACSGHVLVGAAGDAIARYADEHGLDGIVMGTRGLGGMAGVLLGSVASKVAHLASVPVTLVK